MGSNIYWYSQKPSLPIFSLGWVYYIQRLFINHLFKSQMHPDVYKDTKETWPFGFYVLIWEQHIDNHKIICSLILSTSKTQCEECGIVIKTGQFKGGSNSVGKAVKQGFNDEDLTCFSNPVTRLPWWSNG